MFTHETRAPTTPAHQQPIREGVTCLSRDRAESVTSADVVGHHVLGDRR